MQTPCTPNQLRRLNTERIAQAMIADGAFTPADRAVAAFLVDVPGINDYIELIAHAIKAMETYCECEAKVCKEEPELIRLAEANKINTEALGRIKDAYNDLAVLNGLDT